MNMIGTSIPSKMNKKIILLIFSLVGFQFSFAQSFFEMTDDFMQSNVKDGKVAYKKIHQNPSELDKLIDHIAEYDYKQLSKEAQKAYLVNVYNLFVIKNVIDHYPISSPMEVGGFFEGINFKINGQDIDLNQLENTVLRKEYKDSRLHFVLVCGAVGCPPIISQAYTPQNLDNLLHRQTKRAINDKTFTKVQEDANRVNLSQIFNWYKSDFTDESESLKAYINKYLDQPIGDEYKLAFYDYDWTLNGTKSDDIMTNTLSGTSGRSLVQSFTPSSLLAKGGWEFSIFNNLYTQTEEADESGSRSKVARASFFTSTIKVFYGNSKEKRTNIGLIATLKSNSFKSDALSALAFSDNKVDQRAGFTSIAPAIKFTPIKNVGNFSIQSSFTIPLADPDDVEGVFDEGIPYLDRNSYVFNNQFFFDKSFASDKFQIFTEIDFTLIFGEKGKGFANNSISVPASVFLSYFPNSKSTVYTMLQHVPTYGLGDSGFDQEFTQFGLGGKYQLTDRLNLELLFSDFFRGTSSGLGETYNLGLRYILQ